MNALRPSDAVFARVGRFLVRLVRDDAYTDVRGTYPELAKPTGRAVGDQRLGDDEPDRPRHG